MPFAGGAYGMARVSLGLWPGFIVGCCEAVEYLVYVASSALSLGIMIKDAAGTSEDTVPVYCFVFYVIALGVSIVGGPFFWKFNVFLALISIALLLMYCFGSLKFTDGAYFTHPGTTGADPTDLATAGQMFIGGFTSWLTCLPLAGWYYVGVEALNMSSSVISQPRKNIPRGSIACILTLMCTAIFVTCVTASLPPPAGWYLDDELGGVTTASNLAPFNEGYGLMFDIHSELTLAISIPATFATAYGFIFASGRVVICMARSGLFPEVFTITYGKYKTPIAAYLIGGGFSFMLCILANYYVVISKNLFNICMLSGFIAYISQLTGYIIFKRKFLNQQRDFKSPWGVYGAIYGIIVFGLGAISIIAFQTDTQVAFVTMVIFILFYTVVYHLYSRHHQFFSQDEKFIFQVYMCAINSSGPVNIKGTGDGRMVPDDEASDSDSEDGKQKSATVSIEGAMDPPNVTPTPLLLSLSPPLKSPTTVTPATSPRHPMDLEEYTVVDDGGVSGKTVSVVPGVGVPVGVTAVLVQP